MRHREKNKQVDKIRILGIDPGNVTCGYGIIEIRNGSRVTRNEPCTVMVHGECTYITSGRITLSPKSPLYLRLKKLYDALIGIIREYSPHEAVVEKAFFAKNAKAALNLGQARGIALLAAASQGLNVYEYSALEVKKAITGYGRAEKRQVQEMVMRILSPCFMLHAPGFVLTEDAADALALAICHMNTLKLREAINRG
ncbi:MAG: crossover junction endodeoxyribonuclease RuvC [Thermodesulfovibrionales bacterium]|nr:crossover junction endodeoxyribonuclease RuvC [Thermodesulfovibrionales bacterium]